MSCWSWRAPGRRASRRSIVETGWPGVEGGAAASTSWAQGDGERPAPLPRRQGAGREPDLGRGKGAQAGAHHPQHRAAHHPGRMRRGSQTGARDLPPLGGGAGAVGPGGGQHDAIAQKLGRMAAEIFAMEAVADLGSRARRPAPRHRHPPSRRRSPRCGNTEVGWRIVDDCLQIKGGRGYETPIRSAPAASGPTRSSG